VLWSVKSYGDCWVLPLPVFCTSRSYGTEKIKTIIFYPHCTPMGCRLPESYPRYGWFHFVITRNSKQEENTGEEVKFAC